MCGGFACAFSPIIWCWIPTPKMCGGFVRILDSQFGVGNLHQKYSTKSTRYDFRALKHSVRKISDQVQFLHYLRVCASNLSCHGISTFLVEKWSRCAPLITGFRGPKNPVIRGGRKTRVTSHKKSEFLGQKWHFFYGIIFYMIWVKGQLLGVNGPKLAHFYPQNRGRFFSFYPSKNAFQCFGYGKLENFRDRSVTGSRPSPNNLPPILSYFISFLPFLFLPSLPYMMTGMSFSC